jgi:hypothetical protein
MKDNWCYFMSILCIVPIAENKKMVTSAMYLTSLILFTKRSRRSSLDDHFYNVFEHSSFSVVQS